MPLPLAPLLKTAAVAAAVAGASLAALLYYVHRQQSRPRLPFPTVDLVFPYGHAKNFSDFRRLYGNLRTAAGKVNPNSPVASMFIFGKQAITLFHRDHVRAVLTSSTYREPLPLLTVHDNQFFGRGIVTMHHEEWSAARKTLAQLFRFDRLKHYTDVMISSARELVEKLQQDTSQQKPIDLMQYFRCLTFDVIGESGFGVRFGSLAGGEPKEFKAFDYILHEYMSRIGTLLPWRLLYSWPTASNRRYHHDRSVVTQRIKDMISLRQQETTEDQRDKHRDILRYMMESNMSTDVIVDQLLTFLFAGYDTSAITLGYAMYLLAKHPDVLSKVQMEADEVLAEDSTIDYDTVNKLKYTSMVAKETLRLYPPAPVTARTLTENTVINGVKVPAGTFAFIPIWVIQRDTLHWGPDADKFVPERFAEETDYSGRWIPFSAGPRNCIGSNFALLEIKVVLALLCKHFRFEVPADFEPQPEYKAVVQDPKDGIPVTLLPRFA